MAKLRLSMQLDVDDGDELLRLGTLTCEVDPPTCLEALAGLYADELDGLADDDEELLGDR